MNEMEKLLEAIKKHVEVLGKLGFKPLGQRLWKEFVAFKKAIQDADLIELLADLEHRQWIHWMNYQNKKVGHITDMTVDEWYKQQETWQRWMRLAQTPYSKLTEKEKESDREWARKAVELIKLKCVVVPRKKLEEIVAMIDKQMDSDTNLIPCKAPCAREVENTYIKIKELLEK